MPGAHGSAGALLIQQAITVDKAGTLSLSVGFLVMLTAPCGFRCHAGPFSLVPLYTLPCRGSLWDQVGQGLRARKMGTTLHFAAVSQ